MEQCGSIVFGTVIVNEGEVVRPSQLIASVRQTRRGMSEARAIAATTLAAVLAGPAHATHCVSPKATVAVLRGQVVHLAERGSGPVAAGIRIKVERWVAYDVKAVVTDQTD